MDADDWHADPMAGARTGKPNDFLIGPGGDRGAIVTEEAPADLAARIDRLALSEAGTERLAGSPEDGWTTYVQRSKVMGFPDAISVRVAPEGNGSNSRDLEPVALRPFGYGCEPRAGRTLACGPRSPLTGPDSA